MAVLGPARRGHRGGHGQAAQGRTDQGHTAPYIGHATGHVASGGPREDHQMAENQAADLGFSVGAGEGNRTLMTSLEGWGSAIELRPRARRTIPSGEHRQRTRTKGSAQNHYGRRAVDPLRLPARLRHRAKRRRGDGMLRPAGGRLQNGSAGCGAAWLARLLWEQEAAGSNPAIPTVQGIVSGA